MADADIQFTQLKSLLEWKPKEIQEDPIIGVEYEVIL